MSETSGSAPVPVEHAELARRLRSAEDRLFPLAMVDADRYQRATRLVGLLAGRLRETAKTLEELASADADLRVWMRFEELPLPGLDPELVIDAAMAMRFRAILAEQAAELQERALDRAREAGQRWAVLEEPDAAAWRAGTARWIEVHVDTRALMVRSVSADPVSGATVYRLEVTSDGVRAEEYSDRDRWLTAADHARAAHESES
jgi:hypothetical protein